MSSLQRPNTSSMASRGQLPKNGANQKSEEYSPVRKSASMAGFRGEKRRAWIQGKSRASTWISRYLLTMSQQCMGEHRFPGFHSGRAGVNAWRLMAVFDLALPSATTDPQFRAKPFRTRMKMLTRSVVPDDRVF
jgi:hypothetical protein